MEANVTQQERMTEQEAEVRDQLRRDCRGFGLAPISWWLTIEEDDDATEETDAHGAADDEAGDDAPVAMADDDDEDEDGKGVEDAYATQYIVDEKGKLLGVQLLVAYGGPVIWVDTALHQVIGNWHNHRDLAPLRGDVAEAINEHFKELMEFSVE